MSLLLLCLQAGFEPGASAPAPCKAARFLTASTTGAFVAVGDADGVHFLDGATLRPRGKVKWDAAAVVFDEKDETATLLGEAWIQVETKTWTEKWRGQLPDAAFRKGVAGQALATSDGSVWYRSKGSHLSKAPLDIGVVKAEVLTLDRSVGIETVERPLAAAGLGVVVDSGGLASVVLRGKQHALAGSANPLAAAGFGPRVVVVRKDGESMYDAVSWKATWSRTADNAGAAFDLRRWRVYCAGPDAVRHWHPEKPEEVGSFAGGVRALAIDGAGLSLYGLNDVTIRSWRVVD